MIVGVTGHLEAPCAVWRHTAAAFAQFLADVPDPQVLTNLAPGADQMCALLLRHHHPAATLKVILPAADYATTMTRSGAHRFHRLIASASHVAVLGFPRSGPEAYSAAGQAVVDRCDLLVAVWDGEPARGPGGTGDVVAYAREVGCPVRVLWPAGVRR
jgi:hypothetical protein